MDSQSPSLIAAVFAFLGALIVSVGYVIYRFIVLVIRVFWLQNQKLPGSSSKKE